MTDTANAVNSNPCGMCGRRYRWHVENPSLCPGFDVRAKAGATPATLGPSSGKFRKKPVVIEARELTVENSAEIALWCGGTCYRDPDGGFLVVPTLEGDHTAQVGDWIIRGVKGEFYPCKPDIFALTYEPADSVSAPTLRAPEVRRKPTIDELEEILAQEGRNNVEILPSGEIVSRTAAPSDDDASVTFKQGWEAGHRAALEMASPFIRQRAPEVAAMRPLEDRENQYRRICRLIARLDMGDNDVERDLLAEVTNLAANRDDLHDALELLGTVPTPKSTPTGQRPSVPHDYDDGSEAGESEELIERAHEAAQEHAGELYRTERIDND